MVALIVNEILWIVIADYGTQALLYKQAKIMDSEVILKVDFS